MAAIFGQAAALPLAVLTALFMHSPETLFIPFALVACWVLATNRRLSNHSWLGTVAIAAISCASPGLHAVVAHDLLVGVYLTAALLKVSDEHLLTERSASRVVTAHYLRLLGWPLRPRILRTVPFAVVLFEFAVGALLLVPGGDRWSLWLAILMHLAFGVSGNFPFSVVAMALWVTAFSSSGRIEVSGDLRSVGCAALLVGVVALLLGRSAAGRRSGRWLAKDWWEGAVYGAMGAVALSLSRGAAAPVPQRSELTHWLFAFAFVVNFLLVVTGVKLEWSFAMFTSLRPFGRSWLERHRLAKWPRYYTLTLPARVPKPLLREIDPGFVYLATRPESVVHEGVVYRLDAAARKYHVSFSPTLMTADPAVRELVPAAGAPPCHPSPRPHVLAHPAIAPKSLDQHYLG
ncbi:hypothetical protein ACIQM0_01415 [Streptomyces sp. NPDC091387]|uniref:hypothetical protein n=1 Tax=Streptomyces sp. NPDC091387 TaxID=3365998 RepID=UPI0037F1A738